MISPFYLYDIKFIILKFLIFLKKKWEKYAYYYIQIEIFEFFFYQKIQKVQFLIFFEKKFHFLHFLNFFNENFENLNFNIIVSIFSHFFQKFQNIKII